jgi:predicted nucleotidyltransferase
MAEALDFAHRFVARHHPDADAAVLAGSQARGEGVIGSDYDVVLLFPALPDGAGRKMALFEGRHVDVFAHEIVPRAYRPCRPWSFNLGA